MTHVTSDPWSQFSTDIEARLEAEDDLYFWQFALNMILNEWTLEAAAYTGKDCIMTEIGRCSHWEGSGSALIK